MTYSIPPSHAPLLLFPYLFGTGVSGGTGVTGHLYAPAYGGLWNLTELSGYPGAAIMVRRPIASCSGKPGWSGKPCISPPRLPVFAARASVATSTTSCTVH